MIAGENISVMLRGRSVFKALTKGEPVGNNITEPLTGISGSSFK